MSRALLLLLIALLPAGAQDYWHRVTGSVGSLMPRSEPGLVGLDSAPQISIDYGFRFHRYGQFDAGIDTAFATRDTAGSPNERTNIYIPRVGYRVVVPIWEDRIEASVGFGGAHSFFKPKVFTQSWLVYGQLAGDYAIDAARKYRAGMTVRWYRDPIGSPTQQFVFVGAHVSYNFGR